MDCLLTVANVFPKLWKPICTGCMAKWQAGHYERTAVRAAIEEEIRSSPIVIYSYTLSPFCMRAKKLLTSSGADYKEVNLGLEWAPGFLSKDSAAIRAELGAMFGQTSMPHIFIGGQSIGGLVDGTPGLLPLIKDGDLRQRLLAAGAREATDSAVDFR